MQDQRHTQRHTIRIDFLFYIDASYRLSTSLSVVRFHGFCTDTTSRPQRISHAKGIAHIVLSACGFCFFCSFAGSGNPNKNHEDTRRTQRVQEHLKVAPIPHRKDASNARTVVNGVVSTRRYAHMLPPAIVVPVQGQKWS